MSTLNAVPFRSTIFYTAAGVPVSAGSVFTIGTNGVPGFTTNLGSTTISLGASTNQTYNSFTNGLYASTLWGSTLTGLNSIQKVSMSYSGQYQLAVQNSSTINSSRNSGFSWSSLTGAAGLPAGATAYPLTTASGTPNYTSVSVSATSQYILASVRGGLLYTCANGTSASPTFVAAGMGTPTIYAPFENVYTDVMAYSTMNATGSPAFVTGIVGSYAVNLANTAGGTATRYLKEGWTGSSNFAVNFWFNLQSYAGNLQDIFSAYGGAFVLFINTDNKLYWNVASGGGGNVATVAITSYTISLNTWYNVHATFLTGGTCSLYVNNVLIGSYTNSSGTGTLTCTQLCLGCIDSGTLYAFNGYIDDFRLYNSAVTYSPIVPMNWAYTAVSGSGQYMLAAATGGGLFMSSNYGVTWSQVAASITNPLYTGLGISYSGQYMLAVGGSAVTPQQSGLAAASWTQGGVSWATSASSQYSTFAPQSAFNSSTATTWASNGGTYNGSGAWTGSAAAVTIQGVGSISGEWLQLQSNVGLLMQSYTFSCGGPVNQTPKTYYIIGSNDGSTWFPIQYVSMGSNPYTTTYSTASTYITTNQSGSQNLVVGANTAVLTCTTFSTTVNTYTYFRILVTTTHGGGVVELSEWYINFANGQNYSTNYGSSWNRLSLNGATQTFGALSGNGQYALTGTGQIAYLVSNYLAGFSTNTYTTLTLSGINANISGADISATGQYMTIITQGTTNNVYYSTNYGVTFTALTVGSAAMTDCSISADGSYIAVSNATTVYTLNLNTQGFAVSIGNAAGSVNQGQHAIAIGNVAGVTNQSANSIVLNSSGSTLDTYNSGFYVSNISDYGTSYAPSFSLLGYGSDKQVVQGSAITLSPSGYIGIGTTAPSALLHVFGGNVTVNYGSMICLHASYPAGGSYSIGGAGNNFRIALNSDTGTPRLLDIGYYTGDLPTGAWNSKMVVNPISGNVGISITDPGARLHIYGDATSAILAQLNEIKITGNGNSHWSIFGARSGHAYFSIANTSITGVIGTAGTDVLCITSSNNVGIGTTLPAGELHVFSGTGTLPQLTAWNNQWSVFGGGGTTASAVGIGFCTSASTYWGAGGQLISITPSSAFSSMNYYALSHSFYCNTDGVGAAKVVINSSGSVGIGTATVRRTLDVVGTPSFPFTYAPTQLSLSDTAGSSLMNLLIGVSGTSNYASIQSSLSGTGPMPLLLNASGGNVGIGTTTPAFGLSVKNTQAIYGTGALGSTAATGGNLLFYTSGDTYAYPTLNFFQYDHNNCGILFDMYFGAGWFNATTGTGYGIYKNSDILQFTYMTGTAGTVGSLKIAMTINSSGYLGIGITNPHDVLHTMSPSTSVIRIGASNARSSVSQLVFDEAISEYWHGSGYGNNPTTGARGAAYGAAMIQSGNESGNNYENSYMTFHTCRDPQSDSTGGLGVLYERMRINSLGYVGIGTSNPTSQLHIHGTTGSGYWNNSCLRITNGISTTDGVVTNGSSVQLQNGYNASYFNMMTYGYSGGAGSSFYIISDIVVGVVLNRGSNTWSTYSDSRMKIDVTPLPSELSNILKLNPVSYLYDIDPSDNVHIVTRVGFLADEVIDIYPNLVTKNSGMPYTNQAGETFIPMTMCMTDLIPYHTKAIQELASENAALKAQVASLLAWAQTQGFSS